MASENETVEDICKYYKAVWHGLDDVKLDNYEGKDILGLINRIESAWRREKAEMQLALDAEKARHTDDYKDERIRAQDAEIATLKSEMTELRRCLKNTMTAMCNYCRSTPEAKGLPCLNGCETMLAAKRLTEVAEGSES